jgi:hypothetical protein
MLPRRWAGIRQSTAQTTLWLSQDAVVIERISGGVGERLADDRPIESLDDEAWQELTEAIAGTRASIVLRAPDIYSVAISLPKAARARLRSVIALQMQEISPIDPSLVQWVTHRPAQAGDTLDVRVTMVRSGRIREIAGHFEQRGLAAPPIFALTDGERIRLAAGNMSSAGTGLQRTTMWRMLAILAIPAVILVLTLLGAAVLIDRNQKKVAELEQAAAPVISADRRAKHEEQLREAIAPMLTRVSTSMILEDIAGRLPASAFVQSIEQRPDGSLELVVDAQDPDVVRPKLTGDPLLENLMEVNQTPTADAHIRITYVAGGR